MNAKKFFREMGLTKVFTFKGKKYRWTCTVWQSLILLALSIVGFYVLVMFFYLLDIIIYG